MGPHGFPSTFTPRLSSLSSGDQHMAKKNALDWTLALRLRQGFGGARPAPESTDHVRINAQYELYQR